MSDTDQRPITVEAFTAAIEAAVATRGRDFTYPKGQPGWCVKPGTDITCLYVRADADEPGCIIGATLHQLGYPLAVLRRYEGDDVRGVLRALITNVDEVLVEAARVAQHRQDAGCSWGYALDAYLRAVGNVLEVA